MQLTSLVTIVAVVTVSGLGTRKQAILSAGGNGTLDLAILRTHVNQLHMSEFTGDVNGNALDAAKRAGFKDKPKARVSLRTLTGSTQLTHSSDIYADVASRWDCQGYYGYDRWFAGHRNGATGLSNPNTEDIRFYRESVEWIQKQIESKSTYKTDDTRFWVDVTPI
ncbi:hypothetical protein CEK25_009208 [Fusarium fujikuroi]|nr:hypothetical protein CEK25_009208 [Fusarium fujikuroi]